MAQEMTQLPSQDEVYYAYAITRSCGGNHIGALPAEGILPGAAVETLHYRDMLAILSPVHLSQFSQSALEQYLQDTSWVRERIMAHQAVLTSLLKDFTVLPLKFCTVYLSKGGLLDTLRANYASFDQILRQLEGTAEWGVKVYCDLAKFARYVEVSSAALQAQRDAAERAKPGTAYFLRKKLEQATLREAERLVTGRVQDIHSQLTLHARHCVLNKVQTASEHGHSDEMFLNAAYLVTDVEYSAFRATVETLAPAIEAQGFLFELTGPWPPYNFTADGNEETIHG